MMRTMTLTIEDTLNATEAMLRNCHEAFCMGSYTCEEAEQIAAVYRAFGQDSEAEDFMEAHADTDDDEGDMHYRGNGSDQS